jgi:hypothetical protein
MEHWRAKDELDSQAKQRETIVAEIAPAKEKTTAPPKDVSARTHIKKTRAKKKTEEIAVDVQVTPAKRSTGKAPRARVVEDGFHRPNPCETPTTNTKVCYLDAPTDMSLQASNVATRAPDAPLAEGNRIDVRLALTNNTYEWYQGVVIATRHELVSSTELPAKVFRVKFDPDEEGEKALKAWINLSSRVTHT